MTYEEALKLFKDHDYWAEISYIDEACITAIPALEKQIPRKPKIANNIYKQKCYWCPSCSHYFMECYVEDWFNKLMLEAMSHTNAYCPNCGQAIDWSKV